GLTGEYFSSDIAEKASASTFAFDTGVQMPVNSGLCVGASLQNIGGKVKYETSSDNLPQTARAGFNWLALSGSYPTTLLLDGIYRLNQKDFKPALGIETEVGPV